MGAVTLTAWETEVCSRCGGTGNFSYCMSHGTKCFRCKGNKITLTKRGEAAQKAFAATETSTTLVADLATLVGRTIYIKGSGKYKSIVVSDVTSVDSGSKSLANDGVTWNPYFIVTITGVTPKGEPVSESLSTLAHLPISFCYIDGEYFTRRRDAIANQYKNFTKAGKPSPRGDYYTDLVRKLLGK